MCLLFNFFIMFGIEYNKKIGIRNVITLSYISIFPITIIGIRNTIAIMWL
jgi:hypothetical protein